MIFIAQQHHLKGALRFNNNDVRPLIAVLGKGRDIAAK